MKALLNNTRLANQLEHWFFGLGVLSSGIFIVSFGIRLRDYLRSHDIITSEWAGMSPATSFGELINKAVDSAPSILTLFLLSYVFAMASRKVRPTPQIEKLMLATCAAFVVYSLWHIGLTAFYMSMRDFSGDAMTVGLGIVSRVLSLAHNLLSTLFAVAIYVAYYKFIELVTFESEVA